jgi:hypothetical protein
VRHGEEAVGPETPGGGEEPIPEEEVPGGGE